MASIIAGPGSKLELSVTGGNPRKRLDLCLCDCIGASFWCCIDDRVLFNTGSTNGCVEITTWDVDCVAMKSWDRDESKLSDWDRVGSKL